jgi:hypothetical protein
VRLLGRLESHRHFHRPRQRADGSAVPRVKPGAAVEISERQLHHFRSNHLRCIGECFRPPSSSVGELNRHFVAFEAGKTLNAIVRNARAIAVTDGALQPGRAWNCEEV